MERELQVFKCLNWFLYLYVWFKIKTKYHKVDFCQSKKVTNYEFKNTSFSA